MSYAYTIVAEPNRADILGSSELRTHLEKGSDEDKMLAMRQILTLMLNGESMPPNILMDIIRFVLPSRNKSLKKLLHMYWEVVPKLDEDGKLKQEMILVVNAIRNDLQHANEYVRGSTLRFLAKFREPDLLEPLVPTVRACLDHRHAYVRKNAVLCVASIAENAASEHLVPDASEILAEFLVNENDFTCRRNAFVSLAKLDRAAAYAYFHEHYTDLAGLDEMLQLAFVDFVRRDAVRTPHFLPSYIEWLRSALTTGQTISSVVEYAIANTLAALSTSPTVLAEAASKYVDIAVSEPDNNVKITSLGRVNALNERAEGALGHLVMNVLLVLGTPDIGVRKAALDLAMELVSSRTVDQVIRLLKRELQSSVSQTYEGADEYRQAVIGAIHKCAARFQEVTASVVGLLLEFLGDFNSDSAHGVVLFVKEIVEIYPHLRKTVITQLIANLPSIHSSRAYIGALWVVGEYCADLDDIKQGWIGLRKALGPLPLSNEQEAIANGEADEEKKDTSSAPSSKPRVLADGTYAMESPLDAAAEAAKREDEDVLPLRRLILKGDMFIAGALSATFTKLVIRAEKLGATTNYLNGLRAEALLAMTSILRTTSVTASANEDAFDRIYSCIQLLVEGSTEQKEAFLTKPHEAYVVLLKHVRAAKAASSRSERERTAAAVEEPVQFRLLSSLQSSTVKPVELESRTSQSKDPKTAFGSQLKQVTSLTGYSDPIYAEALMTVNQFDIVLDVMLFNQTTNTLQNLAVEFYTCGDLKVQDTTLPANVPPMSFHTLRQTIRVSSADTGVIFGNITYDGAHGSEGTVIILNEIHLNILDYIRPATCSEAQFRNLWTEFEWENKVTINSPMTSLKEFLKLLMATTNMACLNASLDGPDSIDDDSQFLSVNLYARSCFGEDALGNLSIELAADDGRVTGHVRIRAKTQGPAISIGDRLAQLDRK